MTMSRAVLLSLVIGTMPILGNASNTVDSRNLVELPSRAEFLQKEPLRSGGYVTIDEVEEMAEKGRAEANLLMSKLYYYGVYHDVDITKAIAYSRRAASSDPDSYLWDLKIRQISSEVTIDEWLEAASRDIPFALFVVGNYYLDAGPNQDLDLAMFFISRSASKGYERAIIKRSEILNGSRSEVSFEERMSEARRGSIEGLRLLGESYSNGIHTEPNIAKSNRIKKIADSFSNH